MGQKKRTRSPLWPAEILDCGRAGDPRTESRPGGGAPLRVLAEHKFTVEHRRSFKEDRCSTNKYLESRSRSSTFPIRRADPVGGPRLVASGKSFPKLGPYRKRSPEQALWRVASNAQLGGAERWEALRQLLQMMTTVGVIAFTRKTLAEPTTDRRRELQIGPTVGERGTTLIPIPHCELGRWSMWTTSSGTRASRLAAEPTLTGPRGEERSQPSEIARLQARARRQALRKEVSDVIRKCVLRFRQFATERPE